jgi:hypothetical protein
MRLLTAGWVMWSCSAASENDSSSAIARKALIWLICIRIPKWNENNENNELELF